jgi:hypothetical protein
MHNLKIGIIGLPNVGKTTLFNFLTSEQATTGNYFFTTISPNIGHFTILDQRFQTLQKLFPNLKTKFPSFLIYDVAGLLKNAHLGSGLGNEFLNQLQGINLFFHVIRFHREESIIHIENKVDPLND